MSSLRRWEPFRGLMGIQSELDRVFEDFFGRSMEPRPEGVRLPAVDVSETANDVLVKAEMPGVDKKDLEVEVLPESLSLKAEMRQEKEETDERLHHKECIWRRYERTIPLPAEVVTNQVKASMKDGILEVRMPKSERSRAATPMKVSVD